MAEVAQVTDTDVRASNTIGLIRADTDHDVQALFREARRRRRQRRTVGMVLLTIAVVATWLIVWSSGPARTRTGQHRGLPTWSGPGSNRAAPSEFVAGDDNGGIGVYSTATGDLIRTLSPQGAGGPDQQAVLSVTDATVYFAKPNGACGGTIQSGPVSGATVPVTTISVPETLALDPSPSPASSDLAWVGVRCLPNATTSTLYVTDQSTGKVSDLGPYTGRNSDDEIAWSQDGSLLAAETGSTIKVFGVDQSINSGRALIAPAGCTLSDPDFVSPRRQLAAIRTCGNAVGTGASSGVLVFSSMTGAAVARMVEAPAGITIQSISVDPSSGHVLVGLSRANGAAETAQLVHGQLIEVSQTAPTDAQW